jgi:hypothetical protein
VVVSTIRRPRKTAQNLMIARWAFNLAFRKLALAVFCLPITETTRSVGSPRRRVNGLILITTADSGTSIIVCYLLFGKSNLDSVWPIVPRPAYSGTFDPSVNPARLSESDLLTASMTSFFAEFTHIY